MRLPFLLSNLRDSSTHALLLIIACALHTSVLAQPPRHDNQDISRVCLWNADRAIWSELGVTRAQIELLNEIRLRYPAVVKGQWLTEEDEPAPQPAHGPEPGGWGPAPSPAPTTGLQAELRGVLSAEQLTRWHRLCKAPERY